MHSEVTLLYKSAYTWQPFFISIIAELKWFKSLRSYSFTVIVVQALY